MQNSDLLLNMAGRTEQEGQWNTTVHEKEIVEGDSKDIVNELTQVGYTLGLAKDGHDFQWSLENDQGLIFEL